MSSYQSTLSCLVACWTLMSAAAMADDPSVDPCTLITKAEVEQTIGKLKSNPKFEQIDRMRVCAYEFVDAANGLELLVFPAVAIERAREKFKNVSPVKGLGQEAFLHRNTSIDYIELFVRKGNATLQVSLPEAPGDEEKVKAIARKAVSRL